MVLFLPLLCKKSVKETLKNKKTVPLNTALTFPVYKKATQTEGVSYDQ